MTSLFGLSMTSIAAGCVVAVAIIFLVVAYLAWRNPVMFKYGLRNIPRRKAQTTLIVVGLMLSTLIITAAFATGDTLTNSVTSMTYSRLGPIDETIAWDTKAHPAPANQQVIPLSDVTTWQQNLAASHAVKAVLPADEAQLAAIDQRTKLNDPTTSFVAVPSSDLQAIGGLRDTAGKTVQLSPRDVAIDQALADKLNARPGDTLRILYRGSPTDLTVRAVVPNTELGGDLSAAAQEGAALNFSFMGQLIGQPNSVNAVAISNNGSTHGGVGKTDSVTTTIDSLIQGTPYTVNKVKANDIAIAQAVGNVFTTLFVAVGLFSIAAGVLLIFLIFVMLAAERKPEMGMARAVGAKRRQIVESFLAEGMGYDFGSALVGLLLGVVVAAGMILFIRLAAGSHLNGLSLQFSVAARSLIVAFSLGLITTFIVVFLASWRASRINIVAAIRDLPEPRRVNPEQATARGYLRATLHGFVAFGVLVISIFIGLHFRPVLPLAVLAIVSVLPGPWVILLRDHNFGAQKDGRKVGERIPRWPFIVGLLTLVTGIGAIILLGYLAALVLVRLTRERRPRDVPAWLMTAGVILPPLGLVLVAIQRGRPIAWSVGAGVVGVVLGMVMVQWGLESGRAWLFATGISLAFLWVAATLRFFRVHERLSFTLTSFLLLVFWYLIAAKGLEWLTGPLQGGPEMLFVSGVAMITAGTFIVVYNADVILPLLGRFGSRFGRIVPAVKTAVAYPLTSKGRTGLTVAMIGLIMFVLAMQASFNSNLASAFNNPNSQGGYDVRAVVSANNLSNGLTSDVQSANRTLPASQQVPLSSIQAVGEIRSVDATQVGIRDPRSGNPTWYHYTLMGADGNFVSTNHLPLQSRAAGYASDQAAWDALQGGSNFAILPPGINASGASFGPGIVQDPLTLPSSYTTNGFQPFPLTVRDASGASRTITVIGQLSSSATTFWPGIIVSRSFVLSAFPTAKGQAFYVRLAPGTNPATFANQLEVALPTVSADSMAKIISDNLTVNRVFLDVFQGFLALGLIVGIAALGVISFRAVVERRQQIGMLRAIGYQRAMVQLSFLLESGFIAISGIVLGLVLGLTLAWALFATDQIGGSTTSASFSVPWTQLAAVTAFALLASLVMTWLPARAASRVPIAEALRYE